MKSTTAIPTVIVSLVATIMLSGCSAYPWGDRVILIRDGRMETSGVSMFGKYCWVSWYHGIEHIILRADGTAIDPPWTYRWEPLNLSERRDANGFFRRHGCEEPN